MNKIRERFSELVKESGKQQQVIAKEIGITKAQVTHFKTGHNEPNIDMLIILADYFNVCINYLVGRQDYM